MKTILTVYFIGYDGYTYVIVLNNDTLIDLNASYIISFV